MIQGQRSVTINTDDLSFAQSISSGLATTVLSVKTLAALPRMMSNEGDGQKAIAETRLAFIRQWSVH